MGTEELLLLLDTGVKALAGAGIVVIGAWALGKFKNKPSIFHSSASQRKISLLEEVSANVGRVNHSFAKYSALVIESTKFGKRWPPARKAELDRVNAELVREFEKLADAEAKLLMLGEKTMEKTLRLYGAKIAHFRKQVYIGRQDISEQEIADMKTSIMQLRERFYDILSHRYDRLLAA